MKHSRRRRFIDRSVQGKLIVRIIVHWVFLLTATFITLYVWQFLLSGEPQRPFSPQMHDVWKRFVPLLAVSLCLLPAFVWDTVKFSHRFVGPMFRLRTSMRALAKGESVAPIKLRRADFWREAADDFNSLLQRIRAEQTRDSSDALPTVKPALSKIDSPEPVKEAAAPASISATRAVKSPESSRQTAPPVARPTTNAAPSPAPAKPSAQPVGASASSGIRKP